MKEKHRPLEAKINGEWHLVTNKRDTIKLDKHHSLPPYLELDDGRQVHPKNRNIEGVREVKGRRAILYWAKK